MTIKVKKAEAGPLVANRILPSDWFDPEAAEAKKRKVRRFMAYAREVGALDPQTPAREGGEG